MADSAQAQPAAELQLEVLRLEQLFELPTALAQVPQGFASRAGRLPQHLDTCPASFLKGY